MARASYEVAALALRLRLTPPKAGGVVPALREGAPRWDDEPRREPTHARRRPSGFRLRHAIVDLSMDGRTASDPAFADLGCDVIRSEACHIRTGGAGVDNRRDRDREMLYEKSSYFNVLIATSAASRSI